MGANVKQWRPNRIVKHADGRLLELISYSYRLESGSMSVQARTPGDPTTMQTYHTQELTLLKAQCDRDGETWVPHVSGEFRACHIDCPKCYRGYYAVYKGDKFTNAFEADRPLSWVVHIR